jgi:uncharacterized protein (TIGR02246 family)
MMRLRILVFFVAALAAGWAAFHASAMRSRQPPDSSAIQREVLRTLDHGAAAWNKGDLDDFVSDYLDDNGTTYIGSKGLVHGLPKIREAYASRFARGAPRDSLHFEAVEVDVLGPELVNTVAWYVLTRGDSVTARGPTSLVMRRVDGHWRIIHDHSS